jgi:hypothetical protein
MLACIVRKIIFKRVTFRGAHSRLTGKGNANSIGLNYLQQCAGSTSSKHQSPQRREMEETLQKCMSFSSMWFPPCIRHKELAPAAGRKNQGHRCLSHHQLLCCRAPPSSSAAASFFPSLLLHLPSVPLRRSSSLRGSRASEGRPASSGPARRR